MLAKRKSDGQSSLLLYHLGAFIVATAWGVSFISTKILLNNGLNAVEIYIYRFVLAYICVLFIAPHPLFAHSVADEFKFLLCGLTGGSIYFIAENIAIDYTLVTNVSLIVTMVPIFTAFLMGLLYKSERPTGGFWVGSFIAFFGVACVIFNTSFEISLNPLGDLLALLAAVCFAVYSVQLRPLNALYSTWFITRKTFFYGVITALPFIAIEPEMVEWRVLLRPEVMLNLGFLGLVCSMAAYFFWAAAVKNLGAVKSGNYLYLSPIITLIASYWVLHEHITIVGYVGCVLILGGVYVSERLSRPQERLRS